MEAIGRKLTDEGMKNVKKLDTNRNGKLDADEVNAKDYYGGEDFSTRNIEKIEIKARDLTEKLMEEVSKSELSIIIY